MGDNLDLKQIEYVVTIADEKNLMRAAARLYISQPALSHFINALEEELGFPLFIRNRNNWIPTEVGRIYIDGARKILEVRRDTYRIIGEYIQSDKVSIKLGITSNRGSRILYKAFPDFHSQYPHVKLEIFERRSTQLREMIQEGTLDIAMCVWGDHEKPREALLFTYSEPLLLICPKGYKIASYYKNSDDRFKTVDVHTLENIPFIALSTKTSINNIYSDLLNSNNIKIDPVMEVEITNSAIQYVIRGIGVSFVQQVYALQYSDEADFYYTNPLKIINVSMGHRKGSIVTKSELYLAELFRKYLPTT